MSGMFGFDILDNPALGIFWGSDGVEEKEDETVPKNHFSIVAVSANVPGGHNDELSIDGPQRAVVCIEVFDQAKVDIAGMNEFSSMFVPIWQRSNEYALRVAPWNTINRVSNGNALVTRESHSQVLDIHIVPYRLAGRARPIHQIVALLRHVPSGSLYVVIIMHIPSRGDASTAQRTELNRILIAIADKCAAAGLPVIPIGDRNGTIGLWPARYDRAGFPPDYINWRGKGIELRNSRSITRVAGKITDHNGFSRARLVVPTNTLKLSRLPI